MEIEEILSLGIEIADALEATRNLHQLQYSTRHSDLRVGVASVATYWAW